MDPSVGEDNVREQRLQRRRERERNRRASDSDEVRQRRLALRRERDRNRRTSKSVEARQRLQRERNRPIHVCLHSCMSLVMISVTSYCCCQRNCVYIDYIIIRSRSPTMSNIRLVLITFAFRESLRIPGNYVLTMWARSQVHHFQIVGHGDGWFSVDNGPLFQGLDELVHHYQIRPDGLPAQLHDFAVGDAVPLSARKRLETDLHRAVIANDIGSVKRIIAQSKSDVNSQSSDGSTPLHEAAKRGLCDILDLLLQHKPDFNIRDSKGSTPLQVLVASYSTEITLL